MGYTHYWYRPVGVHISPKAWKKICADVEAVLAAAAKEVPLAEHYDVPRPPLVNDSEICFNGVGDDGHETFSVTRKCPQQPQHRSKEPMYFEFCKTAYKPYDAVVVSVLAVLRRHLPKWEFHSDGGVEVFDSPKYAPTAEKTIVQEKEVEVDVSRVSVRWACASCGFRAEVPVTAIAEIGTPQCGDCDVDMVPVMGIILEGGNEV